LELTFDEEAKHRRREEAGSTTKRGAKEGAEIKKQLI